jgi:Holliday junction resolvase
MVNKNYRNGRAREYRVKWKLESLGMIALRSAGSHSPIDVIGIDMEKKIIKFIQCKPDSLSQNKRDLIIERFKGLNGTFDCSFEVI